MAVCAARSRTTPALQGLTPGSVYEVAVELSQHGVPGLRGDPVVMRTAPDDSSAAAQHRTADGTSAAAQPRTPDDSSATAQPRTATQHTTMYRVSEYINQVDFLDNHNSADFSGQVAFLTSTNDNLFFKLETWPVTEYARVGF